MNALNLLPRELWSEILRYLDPEDLFALSNTCKDLIPEIEYLLRRTSNIPFYCDNRDREGEYIKKYYQGYIRWKAWFDIEEEERKIEEEREQRRKNNQEYLHPHENYHNSRGNHHIID